MINDEDGVIRKTSFRNTGVTVSGSNSYSICSHSPVDSNSKYGSNSGSYEDSFGSRSRDEVSYKGRQQGAGGYPDDNEDFDPIGGNGRKLMMEFHNNNNTWITYLQIYIRCKHESNEYDHESNVHGACFRS